MPSEPPHRVAYVAFATVASPSLTVAGKLRLPAGGSVGGRAVVICHGSDGVDGRGEFHARSLNEAGIVTLEIDMWAARGVRRGAAARPQSPVETVADAFAALRFLAEQPEVDPERIGVMGFSWGGVVSLLSATRALAETHRSGGPGFAAHVAHYPVCWAYGAVPGLSLEGRTGAPILIQTGDGDAYDTPGAGERLAARLREENGGGDIEHRAYPAATHGFDRDLPTQIIDDPFAHEGRGGPVTMAFDPEAAALARSAATAFFSARL
jgi:dienelactone hydrolase